MPRGKRLQIPGGIYHVISRGIERRDIFLDDSDREEFLTRHESALEKTGAQCLAWVLMDNHFHLLIRTGSHSLSDLMRKLMTGYAIYFNRKHNRHGYLYQNRYKSVLCQEDVYLLELVRYIHLNPLRAGVVQTLEELDRYRWSGHRVLLNRYRKNWQTVDDILVLFGSRKRESIQKYKEFIKEGQAMGRREDLMGGGLIRSVGGWEGVKAIRKTKDSWLGDERILGEGDFVEGVLEKADEAYEKKERLRKQGWDIDRLAHRVCERYGMTYEELKRRGKAKRSEARSVFCYIGNKELGYSGKELSQYLGISKAAVSQNLTRAENLDREMIENLIT